MQITDDLRIKRYHAFTVHGWWQCLRPCPDCSKPEHEHYLQTNGVSFHCDICGYHEGEQYPRGVLIGHVYIDPDCVGRISPRVKEHLNA